MCFTSVMPPRTNRAVALIAVLTVLTAGLITWRLRDTGEAVPFTADSVQAVWNLRVMDRNEPLPFDIPDLRSARVRYQTFKADLSWRPPPGFDYTLTRGYFSILVAGARNNLPGPRVWANAAAGTPLVYGAGFDRVPDALAWLHGPQYRTAVTTSMSPATGQVTLIIGFRLPQRADWERRVLTVPPVMPAEVLVTLTFIGPQGRPYWAQRLQ